MIDFRQIISTTNRYNFHSHTQFCDGRDVMENFVIAAINSGFKHLGFTPHSPIPFHSPCNIADEKVEEYFDEFNRIKQKYGDRIALYRSFEIDYLNEWGPANDYFKNLDLDYRIGSVHFIPSFVNDNEFIDIDGSPEAFKVKMNDYFYNDIEGVVISFYTQTLKMIAAGHFDIIGHFDKIGYNASCFKPGIEDEKWYVDLVKETFDAIMDCHYWIEINTKAYTTGNRFFPNAKYWKWMIDYNAPVLFNSDVHYPELINAGRSEAMELFGNLKQL